MRKKKGIRCYKAKDGTDKIDGREEESAPRSKKAKGKQLVIRQG